MTTSDLPTSVANAFRAVRRLLRRFETERTTIQDEYTATWKELRFVTERDQLDGGWIAYCIDIPGGAGQGDTEADALNDAASASLEIIKFRLEEAIQGHHHDPSMANQPHQVSVAL